MTESNEIYTGARGLAVKILNRVDRTDAYLDKLLDIELKNSELSSLDKALLNELVHGVTRWQGRLDWILTGFYRGDFSKSISILKNTLRIALYQILFLDNIPHHASVNEAVEFIKRIQGEKTANLANAVLRNIIRNLDSIRYPDLGENKIEFLSVYYSHPTWLVKRWLNRYGLEFTQSLLVENNERPKITLRYNKLRITKNEFIEKLKEAQLKFTESKYLDEFIILSNLSNIADWSFFKEGYFSIQDESAGLPCILLDPKPGETIVDLCAAPGGKTTFLSELMNNEGKIYAVDKYEVRIRLLKKNVERLKLSNIEFVEGDGQEIQFENIDKVLIDAPCSGLGVLTKKPDIKWKRDSEDIKKLKPTQLGLLNNAKNFLKKGGVIVYSTCSIEPEENIEIIKQFLEQNPDFELVTEHPQIKKELIDKDGCISTFPNLHKMDGSFAAKLIKTK